MIFYRVAIAGFISTAVLLTACGGGGNAANTTAAATPAATANSVTVSGATGGQAANNGLKTVASVTATASTSGGTSFTNVVGSLGGTGDRLSVVFVTATGVITDVSLHFGSTLTLPNYMAAVCGPCTGVTVSTSAKTITFAGTAVNNGATPPVTQATLDGMVAF